MKVSRSALLLLPGCVLLAGIQFLRHLLPIFSGPVGYDADPAYVYLFSGMTIIDGHAPSHVDHPGTPLQLLTSAIVLLQWLVGGILNGFSGGGPVAAAIAAPEDYIATVCRVLLVINACATYYFGSRLHKASGSLGIALFGQCALLAYWEVAPRTAYLAPEALLFATSLCLLGLLAPIILSRGNAREPAFGSIAVLAGIVCGFGVAVKVTFFPMLGLLVLLRNAKAIASALMFAAIAWIISVLPILSKLGQMLAWFLKLAMHSGRHGSGPGDVFSASTANQSLQALVAAYPFFYGVLSLLAFFLIAKTGVYVMSRRVPLLIASGHSGIVDAIPRARLVFAGDWRVPAAIFVVCLVQTVLVLKHPGIHYMVPALPLAFVGAVWLTQSGNLAQLSNRLQRALTAFLLVLGGTMAAAAVAYADVQLSNQRLMQDASMGLLQAGRKEHPNALLIGSYRCTLPECALAFGAGYAPMLAKAVAPALAGFFLFNTSNSRLVVFGEGWKDIDLISTYLAEGREVLLDSPYYPQLDAFILVPLVRTPGQNLYRVMGVARK